MLFWGFDGFYRARVGASAAVNAAGSVDYVFAVSLGDGVGGAFSFASSAADAIVIDKICHKIYLL